MSEILGEEIIAHAGERITEEVRKVLSENRDAFRKKLPIAPEMLEAMENYYESEIYINETVSDPMAEILRVYSNEGNRKITIVGNDQRETSLHATLSEPPSKG
jgi:hypothetical protein